MILLILILCILPVALSLDAFEIAQETAGDYRLSAARRFLMSFCFSFFTFIIPVICSVLFRFFFRGLHILDILIPASFIDLLVPLAVLLFFTVTGGKKIVFGYIEYSGKSSPEEQTVHMVLKSQNWLGFLLWLQTGLKKLQSIFPRKILQDVPEIWK